MQKYAIGFVLGLVVAFYLSASYPGSVITAFHQLRIPLLAPLSYSPGR